MAVVNAGEWMEELLLRASIDPLPAPEEGPERSVGFLGHTQRGCAGSLNEASACFLRNTTELTDILSCKTGRPDAPLPLIIQKMHIYTVNNHEKEKQNFKDQM